MSLNRCLYLEDFRQHLNYFDITNVENLNRYVIQNDHPLKIKLDKIYNEQIAGHPCFVALMEKDRDNFFQNLSRQTAFVVSSIEIGPEKWYIKGWDDPRFDSHGSVPRKYKHVDRLLRLPMKEMMHAFIKNAGVSEEIILSEKYGWHLPNKPHTPHNQHYFVVAKELDVLTKEETIKELLRMDLDRVAKLITSLFTLTTKFCYVDSHLGNVRLTPNLKQFAFVETDPFDCAKIIFGEEIPGSFLSDYSKQDRFKAAERSIEEFKRFLPKDTSSQKIIEIIDRIAKEKLVELHAYLYPSPVLEIPTPSEVEDSIETDSVDSTTPDELIPPETTDSSRIAPPQDNVKSSSTGSKVKTIFTTIAKVALVVLSILFFFIAIPYYLLFKKEAPIPI